MEHIVMEAIQNEAESYRVSEKNEKSTCELQDNFM